MTQLLSLVPGNSSPSGLSGGAAPFPAQGPSFAALLSAPSSHQATQLTGFAGLRNAPAMIIDSGQQLARPGLVPGQLAAASGALAEASMPETAMPPVTTTVPAGVSAEAGIALPTPRVALPQAGIALPQEGDVPLSDVLLQTTNAPADIPATAQGESLALQVAGQGGDSPAPMLPEQVLNAEPDAPGDPVLTGQPPQPVVQTPTQPLAQPTAEAIASPLQEGEIAGPSSEPASRAPEGETARLSSEPEPALADAQLAPFGEADSDRVEAPTADETPEMADAAVVLSADGIPDTPAPITVRQRVAATADDSAPTQAAPDSTDISVAVRDSRQAPDAVTLRPTTEKTPDSGGTRDFAQMLQNTSADSATPATEGADGAAEMLAQTRTDPAKFSTETVRPAGSVPGTVSARPGEIGHQLGIEIARHSVDGRDSLTIRLDPAEMGEIHIRLQFDDKGTMRAHVTAESSAALEMLRRDSGDLVRALGDAGVRTDAQSFQFEARSQGRGDQNGQQNRPDSQTGADTAHAETDAADDAQPARSKLLGSGSLDLFA